MTRTANLELHHTGSRKPPTYEGVDRWLAIRINAKDEISLNALTKKQARSLGLSLREELRWLLDSMLKKK